MKNIYIFSAFFLLPAWLLAQYTTPNTGIKYSLTDLVAISDGAVTSGGAGFQIHVPLTIAETDTLEILTTGSIFIADTALITIEGGFNVLTSNQFKPMINSTTYPGFRFESTSTVHLENSTFRSGGGIRALTGNLTMINCTVRDQTGETSSSSALGLSTGKPIITSCTFYQNERPAIGSGATNTVAPIITDCVFIGNNTINDNRPQINLGPSGVDTTIISDNYIQGYPEHTEVGGIGISHLAGGEGHVILSQNTIRDNRYGIAAIGNNLYTRIFENNINDNNTQGDPMLGGSGINVFASAENEHIILNNDILNNLWGITVQGNGMINMGDLSDETIGEGGNVFSDNGNGGSIYALFNNTPNDIMAQGNCWIEGAESTAEQVEGVISHQVDDETLGLVDFSNFLCAMPNDLNEIALDEIARIFPNPTLGNLTIELINSAESIRLYDLSGRVLENRNTVQSGMIHMNLANYPAGVYLIQISGRDFVSTGKIVLQ